MSDEFMCPCCGAPVVCLDAGHERDPDMQEHRQWGCTLCSVQGHPDDLCRRAATRKQVEKMARALMVSMHWREGMEVGVYARHVRAVIGAAGFEVAE